MQGGGGSQFTTRRECTTRSKLTTRSELFVWLDPSSKHRASVNKLKTTPTPNKNGSYGIKWGVSMPYFGGPYAIFFCRNPLILTDFYAIQTPIVWHILGAYFLQILGVGVVRIIFKVFLNDLCKHLGSHSKSWDPSVLKTRWHSRP